MAPRYNVDWGALVEEFNSSGQRYCDFAKAKGVTTKSLWWHVNKKKTRKSASQGRGVVAATPMFLPVGEPQLIEVKNGRNVSIRLPANSSVETIRRAVEALS